MNYIARGPSKDTHQPANVQARKRPIVPVLPFGAFSVQRREIAAIKRMKTRPIRTPKQSRAGGVLLQRSRAGSWDVHNVAD